MFDVFDVSEQLVERLAEEWLIVDDDKSGGIACCEYRVVAIFG